MLRGWLGFLVVFFCLNSSVWANDHSVLLNWVIWPESHNGSAHSAGYWVDQLKRSRSEGGDLANFEVIRELRERLPYLGQIATPELKQELVAWVKASDLQARHSLEARDMLVRLWAEMVIQGWWPAYEQGTSAEQAVWVARLSDAFQNIGGLSQRFIESPRGARWFAGFFADQKAVAFYDASDVHEGMADTFMERGKPLTELLEMFVKHAPEEVLSRAFIMRFLKPPAGGTGKTHLRLGEDRWFKLLKTLEEERRLPLPLGFIDAILSRIGSDEIDEEEVRLQGGENALTKSKPWLTSGQRKVLKPKLEAMLMRELGGHPTRLAAMLPYRSIALLFEDLIRDRKRRLPPQFPEEFLSVWARSRVLSRSVEIEDIGPLHLKEVSERIKKMAMERPELAKSVGLNFADGSALREWSIDEMEKGRRPAWIEWETITKHSETLPTDADIRRLETWLRDAPLSALEKIQVLYNFLRTAPMWQQGLAHLAPPEAASQKTAAWIADEAAFRVLTSGERLTDRRPVTFEVLARAQGIFKSQQVCTDILKAKPPRTQLGDDQYKN